MFCNGGCAENMQPFRALLKYHFRQAVLCNMKGRGLGYDWDDVITPGIDPVAEISRSAYGQLRLKLIMAERLGHLLV